MSTTVEIVKTPDVLHGQPRLEGTRIGVFMLGEMVHRGPWTAAEVVDEYPELARKQVDAALAYYDDHPEEMDALRDETDEVLRWLDERERDRQQSVSDSDA